MKYRQYILLLSVLLLIIITACNNSSEEVIQNNETSQIGSYKVEGEFLYFFQRYGGVNSLGYPLTEVIIADGWRVQYFERGRLEYHPENQPEYRVTVGWLGDLLQRRRPPLPSVNIPRYDDSNRRYFPETGHTLSGDFLRYFEAHGDTVRFGQPISEPFLLNGRLTQDFQTTRFFWTVDDKPPVKLEDTGRVHLELIGGNR